MGTKVHCESYLSGYYSMRDPNEGPSSSNSRLHYSDKSYGNGDCRNGYLGGTYLSAFPGGDKDVLKQKLLEHEAVFKHQVSELHRLYKTQRDMMEEIRRKELHKHRMPVEMSLSSSPLTSRTHLGDARKMQKPNFRCLSSVSGIEVNSSPLSCTGGSFAQADRHLPLNGFHSTDCDMLQCQPSKVRKKLFNLEILADECIDPDEERAHDKQSEISSYPPPSRNFGGGLRVESNGDTSIHSSRLRNPIGLDDLNEPVRVDGATSNRTTTNSLFLLGMSKELLKNPQHRSGNSGISNGVVQVKNEGNGRERLSFMHEEGDCRSNNLNFIPQGPQRDKLLVMSSKPVEPTLDNIHHHLSVLQSDHVRHDLWREKLPETSRDLSGFCHFDSVSSLTHKLTLTRTSALLNSLGAWNTSSETPLQSHKMFTDQWRFNGYMDPPAGFPSNKCENVNCSEYDEVASERSINYCPSSHFKGSAKEVNLNVCPSRSSCAEIIDLEKKCEDRIKVLPWLKTETEKINKRKIFGVPIFDKLCPTPKNESSSPFSTSASLKDKGKNRIIDINIACDIECGTEVSEEAILTEKRTVEKAASFRTIIDLNSCISGEDKVTLAPSAASTSAGKIMIDLEVPAVPNSDEDILPVEQPHDEAVVIAAQAIITISSDFLESVEETTSQSFEAPSTDPLLWFVEVVSSFMGDFGNLGIEAREKEGGKGVHLLDVIDGFEALTLNLKEMTEEEYMPKPLAQEVRLMDGNRSGDTIEGQLRKGQGRRGRQRRDFQRDILPGLASLSRHEVTEDIQTFGGLMRAMGHVWSSGLTRRNGTRSGRVRGRRRVVVDPPIPDVEPSSLCRPSLMQERSDVRVDLEDRSLMIWGRTPRRPRRQRCPPGNHPPSGSFSLIAG